MSQDKDIRYTDKKVDESWKDHMTRDKTPENGALPADDRTRTASKKAADASSKHFLNLVSSLGYQAMMQLGELPDPATQKSQVNLELAREMIELLAALKEKTEGNLHAEESRLLNNLLTELQLKFSQKV